MGDPSYRKHPPDHLIAIRLETGEETKLFYAILSQRSPCSPGPYRNSYQSDSSV